MARTAFVQHMRELQGFLSRHAPAPNDADDLLQQVFLRAYSNCERIPELSDVRAWLFRITRNLLTDLHRQYTRHPQVDLSETAVSPADTIPELDPSWITLRLVSRLPELYREVLVLVDLEELSIRQAAQQLGLSETAVKSRASRARHKLRLLFDECTVTEHDRYGNLLELQVRSVCEPILLAKGAPCKDCC